MIALTLYIVGAVISSLSFLLVRIIVTDELTDQDIKGAVLMAFFSWLSFFSWMFFIVWIRSFDEDKKANVIYKRKQKDL